MNTRKRRDKESEGRRSGEEFPLTVLSGSVRVWFVVVEGCSAAGHRPGKRPRSSHASPLYAVLRARRPYRHHHAPRSPNAGHRAHQGRPAPAAVTIGQPPPRATRRPAGAFPPNPVTLPTARRPRNRPGQRHERRRLRHTHRRPRPRRWSGRADILRRVEGRSQLGDWVYEVVDTKLSRETKAGTILQLCLYSDMMKEIQGTLPDRMHVVSPGADPK